MNRAVGLLRLFALVNAVVGIIASVGFVVFAGAVYRAYGLGADGLVLAFAGIQSVLPLMATIAVVIVVAAVWLESRGASVRSRSVVYALSSLAVWAALVAKLLQWWPGSDRGIR